MQHFRPTNQFPAVSTDLAQRTQHLLTDLEEKLVESKQARILVQIEPNQRAAFFLACVERLLRYTKSRRLLILTSATAQADLQAIWQTATSKENGQLLIQQFPTHFSLTWPLGEKARVWISTVRELQLQQVEQLQHLATSFDILLVYDFPTGLSPVWKRVIEKQQVHYLIALCEQPKQEVVQWFEGVIIGAEPER